MEVQRMSKAVREAAAADVMVMCWWCGGRPADGKWQSDHIFPLLGVFGPMAACCADCNMRRKQQIPDAIQQQRLFRGEYVLLSVPQAEVRALAREHSTRLFGSRLWIDLLIACVEGKAGKTKPVYYRGKKSKISNNHLGRLGLL